MCGCLLITREEIGSFASSFWAMLEAEKDESGKGFGASYTRFPSGYGAGVGTGQISSEAQDSNWDAVCCIRSGDVYFPLTLMRMVIQTRSVEYMPFTLSLFNFINGLVRFGYAFVEKPIDVYIAILTGLGAISGICQLALYAIYRNATPRPDRATDKAIPEKPVNGVNPNSIYIEMEKNNGSVPSRR